MLSGEGDRLSCGHEHDALHDSALQRARPWLERLVLALGLCLPVPLLAATGLSLPMPAVVERLAAALVPWADDAIETGQPAVLTRGAIVRAAGEPEPRTAAVAGASRTMPAATPARVPLTPTEGAPEVATDTAATKRVPPGFPAVRRAAGRRRHRFPERRRPRLRPADRRPHGVLLLRRRPSAPRSLVPRGRSPPPSHRRLNHRRRRDPIRFRPRHPFPRRIRSTPSSGPWSP